MRMLIHRAQRLGETLSRHPWIMLGLLVLIAVPLGLLVGATAGPPDPGVRQLAMSWQTIAGPMLNAGVDAGGLTLEQWTRGVDYQGRTLEAWTIAGGDAKLWVQDPRTRRRPEDWRPVEVRTVRAGSPMYVLRHMEFRHKMAEPRVHRLLFCGDGTSGVTPIDLGSVPAPTRSDGASVKNHPTLIPAWVLPPGVTARACTYRASAEFLTLNPLRSAWLHFPEVAVTVVR